MQTLEHLFEECKHVHPLLNLLVTWWNSSNLSILSLTSKKFTKKKRSFHTFNICLIVALFYICVTGQNYIRVKKL